MMNEVFEQIEAALRKQGGSRLESCLEILNEIQKSGLKGLEIKIQKAKDEIEEARVAFLKEAREG
jgi:hypothetical protein